MCAYASRVRLRRIVVLWFSVGFLWLYLLLTLYRGSLLSARPREGEDRRGVLQFGGGRAKTDGTVRQKTVGAAGRQLRAAVGASRNPSSHGRHQHVPVPRPVQRAVARVRLHQWECAVRGVGRTAVQARCRAAARTAERRQGRHDYVEDHYGGQGTMDERNVYAAFIACSKARARRPPCLRRCRIPHGAWRWPCRRERSPLGARRRRAPREPA